MPETHSTYSLLTNRYIDEMTGFRHFKSIEQKLCVHGALNTPCGYTTLISMPTGGGKSLVTQAVSYKEKGLVDRDCTYGVSCDRSGKSCQEEHKVIS